MPVRARSNACSIRFTPGQKRLTAFACVLSRRAEERRDFRKSDHPIRAKYRREELALNKDHARLLRQLGGASVNRRSLIQRGAALGLGSAALAAGAGPLLGFQGARARQDAPDSGVKGGKLRVAIIGE